MNISSKDQGNKADKALESLFKQASKRKRAPCDREREIRAALHSEWRHSTRRHRRRKQVLVWASAASIVLALFVSAFVLRPLEPVQPLVVATVEKIVGLALVSEGGGDTAPLLGEARLSAGVEISTSRDSRLALAWAGGESVRVDQDSLMSLVSRTEIRLSEGKVYVDSSNAGRGDGALVIQTPSGPVQHVGTQYITVVSGGEVTVSVREGEVSLGSGDAKSLAVQGQRLRVTPEGQRTTTPIETYGEDWQWIELVAPRFNTDGRSIREFLEWVGRETGRKIEYGSQDAKLLATRTRMHGEIDLEPMRAMELMLQTSDLVHSVKDGVILVSF